MKKPILHILEDEKVTNSFIDMMETVFPNESKYLILLEGSKPTKVSQRENVVFIQKRTKELADFLYNTSGFRHICLHSINGERDLQRIKHPSMSWVIWGWDLYENLLQFKGYRLYENPWEQFRVRAKGRNTPIFLYRFLSFVRDYRIFRNEKRIIKRLKYIITDNGCDYDVFQKYYTNTTIKFLGTINYYPIEKLIGKENLNKECNGTAIWVGNSPAANGNHTSVFKKLASYSNNTKIYSPISYGDNRFMAYLNTEGKRILGDKFCPLRSFMPPEQYYSLFLNANSFVFGHYRQCGVGNILMALYFGGKCFFYKRNPLYQMYLDYGFIVFSIDDDLNESFAKAPLADDIRMRNRELVMSIASYKSSLEQLKQVFGKI